MFGPNKILSAVMAFLMVTVIQLAGAAAVTAAPAFRPPAVPLVTFDPYMSIWSENNTLAKHPTRYWDHRIQNLVSLVRIDGTAYRLMGGVPASAPVMRQLSVTVRPTTTIYRFTNGHVRLTLTFMTPRLPAHLKTMTLPVTYITWTARSADGNAHQVQVYYSTSTAIAVNHDNQQVTWSREKFGPLTALKAGSTTQNYFDISGDPVGLDWGYIYTVVGGSAGTCIASNDRCISRFMSTGAVQAAISTHKPRVVSDGQPVEAVSFDLGSVGASPVSRHVMVAYDEVYAIDYFGESQRPYWRHIFHTPSRMFQWAAGHYSVLMKQSAAFDSQVIADARKIGRYQYATVASMAYRQALAAMGMSADANGKPMVYTKEETSNGDIATVDVFFPASPLLLTFCPQLEAASMVPVLNSASSPRWKFAWSPHDLGTYPICTGHYNTGGENMMVEESGNMIILAAAIAKAEGNPDFAVKYWPLLTKWVRYLRKSGFDPGKQLSTNDFLGFMAHNANLSIKAIVAMGAYGMLCRMRGMTAEANDYQSLARRWARKWMRVDRTGNHYRMAFNQPGTWSMVYNMVWDQALGLNIFPRSVRRREMAFYMTQLHRFGLPDRSTVTQTKTDFEIWTATLATKQSQFQTIIDRIYKFLDQTKVRVPFADQYGTRRGWAGMHARPVMGAAFMPIMNNAAMWKKWASAGAKFSDNWAPLPPPPVVKTVVPTARHHAVYWHYTIHRPAAGWNKPGFHMTGWKTGAAGFGTPDPGVLPRTAWHTDNIWLRRMFTMPAGHFKHLRVYCYHDEDVQIYINGVLAASAPGYSTTYVPLQITPAGRRALHAGRNLMAVHVLQTTGGQFFDAGLVQWYVPHH